jgi:hypothetical protein
MARGRKKRRRARGLVVGHLERVSGDVFVNRSDAITELAGNRPGIYALYRTTRSTTSDWPASLGSKVA